MPKGNESGTECSSGGWTFLISFLGIYKPPLEHTIDGKAQPYIILFLYQMDGNIANSGLVCFFVWFVLFCGLFCFVFLVFLSL